MPILSDGLRLREWACPLSPDSVPGVGSVYIVLRMRQEENEVHHECRGCTCLLSLRMVDSVSIALDEAKAEVSRG